MTHRDLPYYEGIRPKHTVNINFTKISTKIMQTFTKWSITWSITTTETIVTCSLHFIQLYMHILYIYMPMWFHEKATTSTLFICFMYL